jgi:zinc D-Ala-D-Ala carboxypeptidase
MSKYFSFSELKCKCGKCNSTGEEMSPVFMHKLDMLRELIKSPIILSSAYRCPEHNARVSSTGLTGPHTTGCAVDISCRGAEAHKLLQAIIAIGFTGIGVNQKGNSRFIHVDNLTAPKYPRANLWSY